MAREEMLAFTRSLFRGRPDLSTLTHSIVRRRFLAHVGRDHLEPDEKQALKRLVEEELLKTQVDEAGGREEKPDLAQKVKRSPSPCSDPERKRPRFNSESEPSSEASSPECLGPAAKKRMTAVEASLRRASERAGESSDEEEEQDVTAKMGSEEEGMMKDSSEDSSVEEGSARASKAQKGGSSEEEEDEEKLEPKGRSRSRKKPVARSKPASGKASARRKQASEEEEEEEPIQRTRKAGRKSGASPREREDSEEEEEKEEREAEDRTPRVQSNGGDRSACEDTEAPEEQAGTGSGDSSGEEPKNDRVQSKGRKRQSGSSEDDREDSQGKATSTTKGKTAKAGRLSGDSDSERELSDSEAGESPKGERKNRSSKKNSKKSRTRSSSSSTDGSPEPRGGKAGSGRRGEDHPAVTRLKRYIRACGAHRNYKKLLGSCRSHKERLSVLRAELEALGMKGNPSLEKCRVLKEQREEAAEVASLDVTNIIHCSGRPRRRTAWNPSEATPSGELYRRTLDSEEEQPRRPPPDWSHMRGIISSDGESN